MEIVKFFENNFFTYLLTLPNPGGGVKMTHGPILSFTAPKRKVNSIPNLLTFPKMLLPRFWKKKFGGAGGGAAENIEFLIYFSNIII